eukprot:COSAG02_NODE_21921_length_770_cov_0.909091_1_plen_185_part_00
MKVKAFQKLSLPEAIIEAVQTPTNRGRSPQCFASLLGLWLKTKMVENLSFQTVTSPGSNAYAIPDHFNWFSFGGSFAEYFLLISIVCLLVYGVWYSTSPFLNYPSLIENVMGQAILILLMTLWMAVNRFQTLPNFVLYQHNLIFDDFSFKMSIVLISSTIICLLLRRDYLKLFLMIFLIFFFIV